MTPLVHVRDAGTTFLESACGLRALALALHLSRRGKERIFDLAQPGGSVLRVRLCTEQDAAAPGTNPWTALGPAWTAPWRLRRKALPGWRTRPNHENRAARRLHHCSAATGAALAALCLLREGHAPHEVDVPLPPFAPGASRCPTSQPFARRRRRRGAYRRSPRLAQVAPWPFADPVPPPNCATRRSRFRPGARPTRW